MMSADGPVCSPAEERLSLEPHGQKPAHPPPWSLSLPGLATAPSYLPENKPEALRGVVTPQVIQ